MSPGIAARATDETRPGFSSLYRAVWRWHFFAGLAVVPVLLLLALTGSAYLFKSELDLLLYRPLVEVSSRNAAPAPPSVAVAAVEKSLGGRVIQITLPRRGDRSIVLLARIASGDVRTAYADPYDGHYLGATEYGGVMQTVRKLHSLQMFGFGASSLVEIAAGWSIILVGTGAFLWWPRGQRGGVVTIRGTPKARIFWRDFHALTGIFAGAVIVFLAVTGMPWSMFWGDHVQKWASAKHLGRPDAPADVTPQWLMSATMPDMPHDAHNDADLRGAQPWALQQVPAPMSHAGHAAAAPIGLDRAVILLEQMDFPRPYSVSLPEGSRGAYTATYAPDRVEDARTIYLDQFSGAVLDDVGFAEYGAAARVIEWGIAVHQGQEFGWINRYVMLSGCLGIIVLSVSSITMWWMRRPRGHLGVPPAPANSRMALGVLCVIGVVGIIYPLTGLSMAGALLLDWLWRSFRSRGLSA